MSFWRRWLKQWGYVRIRDYGLVVTDAGQVIRVSDGVVVSAPAAPAPALLAGSPAPAYPFDSRPPTPTPMPSPLRAESAQPAPAFAPPSPPAPVARAVAPPVPKLPLPPVPRAEPARVRAPRPRRAAAGSKAPPIARTSRAAAPSTLDTEPRDDTTVVDHEPTVKEPPLRAGISTRRQLPTIAGIGAQVGDATVVDSAPRKAAPLPRLSARLAARRKT